MSDIEPGSRKDVDAGSEPVDEMSVNRADVSIDEIESTLVEIDSQEVETPNAPVGPLEEPAQAQQAAATELVAQLPVTAAEMAVVAPVDLEPTLQNLDPLPDADIEFTIKRISRRSFLWGVAGAAGVYEAFHWLSSRPTNMGIPWPLRRALEFNEGLARTYFKDSRLAPTFPLLQSREPRANGAIGMDSDLDADAWKLYVVGLEDSTRATMVPLPIPAVLNEDSDDSTVLPTKNELALVIDLAAIVALPRVEMVTELKCIEGWSTIVQWTGARFADFVTAYAPRRENGALPRYVALQTPDGKYFVGMDMESALHPQTLLCYEMNGARLSDDHGAPLRLVTPVKYGIKHIKRIGVIRFTNDRPIDYWAELGYDWYAGH